LPNSPTWSSDGGSVGSNASLAADLDGDSLADIVVSSETAKVGQYLKGRVSSLLPQALRPGTTIPVGIGGRSPSKAVDLRLLAQPISGRTRIKLQVEVKVRGTAFNGSGLKTSPSWIATTIPPSTVTLPVTGLAAATAYHWRARLIYDPSMGFPASHSRWYYGSTQVNGVHFRTP
jgi:hypothetical protein